MFPADATCDNCGNNIEVELDEETMAFWCMPCREAQKSGDLGTFVLRREMLYDG